MITSEEFDEKSLEYALDHIDNDAYLKTPQKIDMNLLNYVNISCVENRLWIIP